MIPYEAESFWPWMPKAVVFALLRRYEGFRHEYGKRWQALYVSGYAPGLPDPEVFEAAWSTLVTYWYDEGHPEDRSQAIIDHTDIVVDGGAYDWILDEFGPLELSPFYSWAWTEEAWPPPMQTLVSSHLQTYLAFVVWRMFLLHLTEEWLSLQALHWREKKGVAIPV